MPYNDKLMKGRAWVYAIGAVAVAAVALWKIFIH
jgi:hypothetical protein